MKEGLGYPTKNSRLKTVRQKMLCLRGDLLGGSCIANLAKQHLLRTQMKQLCAVALLPIKSQSH